MILGGALQGGQTWTETRMATGRGTEIVRRAENSYDASLRLYTPMTRSADIGAGLGAKAFGSDIFGATEEAMNKLIYTSLILRGWL